MRSATPEQNYHILLCYQSIQKQLRKKAATAQKKCIDAEHVTTVPIKWAAPA